MPTYQIGTHIGINEKASIYYKKQGKDHGYDPVHAHALDINYRRTSVHDFNMNELEYQADDLQSAIKVAIRRCNMLNLRRVVLYRNNYGRTYASLSSQTPIGEIIKDKNGWAWYKYVYSQGKNIPRLVKPVYYQYKK